MNQLLIIILGIQSAGGNIPNAILRDNRNGVQRTRLPFLHFTPKNTCQLHHIYIYIAYRGCWRLEIGKPDRAYLLVAVSVVRLLAEREDLPEHDAVRPDVALRRVPAVDDTLDGHPAHRQHPTAAHLSIIVRFIVGPTERLR